LIVGLNIGFRAKGKVLDENGDFERGVNKNSRIIFTALQDGSYRLVAITLRGQGMADYALIIRKFAIPRK
jgi:hypothetical protein